MLKVFKIVAATLTVAVAAITGYRYGAGEWPALPFHASKVSSTPIATSAVAPNRDRKVLYWMHPDGSAAFSPTAKTTQDGRPYVPVYEDEEKPIAGSAGKSQPHADRKIKYYRNPMGLPDTSPVPKKDSMGMDYIPVYEGEDDDTSTIKLSVAKIQRSGVRTVSADLRRVTRPVRAPGMAKLDERTLYSVTLRADGFIEKLYVNEEGMHVEKGQPLFKLYSPDMVRVQVDYRISTAAGNGRDDAGALQRLENLQLPADVVEKLKRTREPTIAFDWPSPASGFILKKNAVDGMMMKAGDEIYRIAELSSIWVVADVAEQDIGQIRIGQSARVRFKAFPGEVFEGKVTFILHELEMTTRTAKVRIQLDNPEHRIKHEMFADVEIATGEGEPEQLAVPLSALIDSGKHQVVLIELGEGRFEPREVKVGTRGEQYVAITNGLRAGEKVVVSANFLIDAESNLRAALSAFSEGATALEADTYPDAAAKPTEEQRP